MVSFNYEFLSQNLAMSTGLQHNTKNIFNSVWANIAWREVFSLGELTVRHYSNTVHLIVYPRGGGGSLILLLLHISYRSSLFNKFNTMVFSTRYILPIYRIIKENSYVMKMLVRVISRV